MREVMHDGKTWGRVALTDVLGSKATVGIGALEGLRGEIAIVDGVAWVARVEGGQLICTREARASDRATLLALSDVEEWQAIRLDEGALPGELEPLLARVAEQTGLGCDEPWPFVIEGELVAVESHVLNGKCPFAGTVEQAYEPLRRSIASQRGRLIGFYAPSASGTLVHHGQTTHVHIVLDEPNIYVGHVDRTGVGAGATLLVPRRN